MEPKSVSTRKPLVGVKLSSGGTTAGLSASTARRLNFARQTVASQRRISQKSPKKESPRVAVNASPKKNSLTRLSLPKKSADPLPMLSPIKHVEYTISDFQIGKKLGQGKFGKVYCVKHIKSGVICALKAMDKQDLLDNNAEKQFKREVLTQASLSHPHILKLYGYFHDEKRVYLILEYMIHGEIYRVLKLKHKFSDAECASYISQIASALQYLHERGIAHRDIKPENILLGFNSQVKISDFGWCCNVKEQRRKTMCGTLDYLPPEMVEQKDHDYRVDIWALGVLCYEFLCGAPPFEHENPQETYRRISRVDLHFPDFVSKGARDLITKLLQHDPEKRISLKYVQMHPWITANT